MKRRNFLIGAGAALGAAALARPGTQGNGGHDAYFQSLSVTLAKEGLARPTMIIDLDRLDANIDVLRSYINGPLDYRIVAKSLPSAGLIDYISRRANSRRLMVFHQPFMNDLARKQPAADMLVGKPMPVAAAARFYDHLDSGGFDPARQLQWLIDTPERLDEYAALAQGRDTPVNVNIEIDVGLHRGGMTDLNSFAEMLNMIEAAPNLSFSGLMGYDAHVSKMPTLMGWQAREFQNVQNRYQGFLDVVTSLHGSTDGLTLNAGGSPTYQLYKGNSRVNEVAAGSGLVKALDFDIPTLADHQAALFIATPVLKAEGNTRIPGVPGLGNLMAAWNPNRTQTFFIYGGFWKARAVSPAGLIENPLYGHSTNQEILNGSKRVALGVNDYVFMRPTQSEFVMLQFGDIVAMRGGQIEGVWPTLEQVA
ncbi:MAG: DSD1 family PLP-dependent enzyme [Alphaproteobacteria bacterium]